MPIRFGRPLDGLQPYRPETTVGAVSPGPAGLLAVLETQVGLPPRAAHPSESAFSYLQCLREGSTPDRFYDRSLQVDPVNVARALLEWREQWYEAGWVVLDHKASPRHPRSGRPRFSGTLGISPRMPARSAPPASNAPGAGYTSRWAGRW